MSQRRLGEISILFKYANSGSAEKSGWWAKPIIIMQIVWPINKIVTFVTWILINFFVIYFPMFLLTISTLSISRRAQSVLTYGLMRKRSSCVRRERTSQSSVMVSATTAASRIIPSVAVPVFFMFASTSGSTSRAVRSSVTTGTCPITMART